MTVFLRELTGRRLSVFSRRRADNFVKDAVELGKGSKAALRGDVRDLAVSSGKLVLGILDPGRLDVLGDIEMCDLLEFTGKIAGT